MLLIVLAFFTIAKAQEISQDAVVTDTSMTYLIKLDDHTTLTGKITSRTNTEINFIDITIGKVTIPVKKVVKLVPLSGEQLCILTTNDGKTFTGLLVAHNDTELKLKTESLGILTISNSKIRDIKLIEKEQMVNGRYYFPNPHPTRYFFGPSAIPLPKGEGYYQNAYVLANSVQAGVTDNFSMGGGVVIPFMFFITPKLGYKVGENTYVGGGILAATTISSEIPFGIGIGYGSFTMGNNENSFTINAGWGAMKEREYTYDPISFTDRTTTSWSMAKRPIFSLSAMIRLAPKVAMVTENWFFATKDYENVYPLYQSDYEYRYHSVFTFGFRIMGEKNSFDLALAVPSFEGQTIGIPYLDYVFKF